MTDAMPDRTADDAAALFLTGEAVRRQGRPAEAAGLFRRALADDPRHAPSLHRLGNAHKALGRWEEAERAYRHAAILDGGNAELLRQHANVLKDLDRPDEAEPVCRSALALAPEDETLHYALSVVLSERSRHGSARTALRTAIIVRPDYGPALHRYGLVLKDEGRVAKAATALQRALRADPLSGTIHHRVAMALRELERPDLAVAAHRRAIALAPGDGEALYQYGALRRRDGDLESAAALCRHAVTADPALSEAKAVASVVEAQRGAGEIALSLWLDAVGLDAVSLPAPAETGRDAARPPGTGKTANAGRCVEHGIENPGIAGAGPVAIATSLMPRRIEEQRAAIDSWRALGFTVISVNTAAEIERLEPLFPGVRFEPAERTAEDVCGKPLVFLDDCLHALERCGAPVCGIVNSDIVLPGSDTDAVRMARHARGGLLFASRINVANLEAEAGWVYEGGYDVFLFDRSVMGVFMGSGMVIGAPWWDYWMPLAAVLAGLSVAMPRDLRALHCTHELGYSKRTYLHFGAVLVAAAAALVKRPGRDRLPEKAEHPLAAHAARALPPLARAGTNGGRSLSTKGASMLGQLVVDTVTTVARPVSVAVRGGRELFFS